MNLMLNYEHKVPGFKEPESPGEYKKLFEIVEDFKDLMRAQKILGEAQIAFCYALKSYCLGDDPNFYLNISKERLRNLHEYPSKEYVFPCLVQPNPKSR